MSVLSDECIYASVGRAVYFFTFSKFQYQCGEGDLIFKLFLIDFSCQFGQMSLCRLISGDDGVQRSVVVCLLNILGFESFCLCMDLGFLDI